MDAQFARDTLMLPQTKQPQVNPIHVKGIDLQL